MNARSWLMAAAAGLALPVALSGASATWAAPGDLDPSFGTGGIVATPGVGDQYAGAKAVAIQPDGKIVAAGNSPGNFEVFRYRTDGSLDPSFGSGGRATISFAVGATHDIAGANAVALQPDGKIVAAGTTGTADNGTGLALNSYDFALARLLPDGSLDPSFGTGGKLTSGFAEQGDDIAYALLLQGGDGRIVAVGSANRVVVQSPEGPALITTVVAPQFGLARYNSDGTPDVTFGNGGMVATSMAGSAHARAAVLQPDGKIVAGGDLISQAGQAFSSYSTLARYQSSGALDTGFGNGGIVQSLLSTSNTGEVDHAGGLARQNDGKLVVAASDGGGSDFVLVRYQSSGAFDPSFGPAGKRTFSDFGAAYAVAVQPDGRIVAVGGYSAFVVARILPDGTPDPAFGSDGLVTTPSSNDPARAVALLDDGRIVAAGGRLGAFVLARYLGAETVGVPELEARFDKLALEVFPTPARGHLTMALRAPGPGVGVKLEVIDVLGRVLRRWDLELAAGASRVLSWDGLRGDGRRAPSGVYVVRASTPEGAIARRVLLAN